MTLCLVNVGHIGGGGGEGVQKILLVHSLCTFFPHTLVFFIFVS